MGFCRGPDQNMDYCFDKFGVYGTALFIVNAKDRACSTYYTGKPRAEHVSGWLLLRLPSNLMETLVYFDLCTFATRMGRIRS